MPDPTGALAPFAAVWCAAVGAAVGSFLNVVIARVPSGESLVHPGSRCPACGASIRWYDNVPLLSWCVLRARCRDCGARISARYPIVEAIGAATALVAFARHGLSGVAAAEFAFTGTLVALAFIDVDTWLLPNAITWPLAAFGLLMGWLGVTPAGSVRWALYGAGLGYASFRLLAWIGEKAFRKEALGIGDVWLLAGLGAWMGPAALLPLVLLASIQGAVVGAVLIALGRGEPGPEETARGDDAAEPRMDLGPRESELPPPAATPEESPRASESEAVWIPPRHAVPFGPFLVAGALEWLWLGGLLGRAVPVLQLFR